MPIIDKSNGIKLDTFGNTIRSLRESRGLLLRQVAAFLEVDTAFLSKLERGEKRASREMVCKLAAFLHIPEQKLLPLWLCDRIMETLNNDPYALEALKLTQQKIKNLINE